MPDKQGNCAPLPPAWRHTARKPSRQSRTPSNCMKQFRAVSKDGLPWRARSPVLLQPISALTNWLPALPGWSERQTKSSAWGSRSRVWKAVRLVARRHWPGCGSSTRRPRSNSTRSPPPLSRPRTSDWIPITGCCRQRPTTPPRRQALIRIWKGSSPPSGKPMSKASCKPRR
ncbi:hypothetical protein D3C84_841400 [compost metagenome]